MKTTNSKSSLLNRSVLLVFAPIVALGLMVTDRAMALSLTPLHSFSLLISGQQTNSDGASPYAGLTLSGNTLFGTSGWGGTNGNGTVFSVQTNGTGFADLHNFVTATDGANPLAGLVLSGNMLYGMASAGGSSGKGTVFSINTNTLAFTKLYTFTNGTDGATPLAGLVLAGNMLYGTASAGGSSGNGTVFSINTNTLAFTTLYKFTNGTDGANPQAGLILSGNMLYGTAAYGGSGNGTVFAINTNTLAFTALHSFVAATDGANPQAGLILSGNLLYGTAAYGGSAGNGTVFAINTNTLAFTTLHSFPALVSGINADGANPEAGLTLVGGTLFGTATGGGSSGYGTVFNIVTNGTGFTTVYNFLGGSDGDEPAAGLIYTLSGNVLYGTAVYGGSADNGTVFALQLSLGASATAVSSSSNPSVYGQSGVTFTATVTSSLGAPTGTVVFKTNTVPFSTNTLSGGSISSASLPITLAPGSYTVTATYSGDGDFATSTGTLSGGQTVGKANSSTAVVTSLTPSVYGVSTVKFTATVTDNSGGSTGTPSGTVQFQTNGVAFGSPVALSTGTASLPLTTLPVGSYTAVTAVYSGDANFFTSTGTMVGAQTVTQAATSTAVVSTGSPSTYGQNGVIFTATVSDATGGSIGTPTGTVQFQTNGVNFGAAVALSGVANASSVALSTTLASGTYAVTAIYSGDPNFTTSTGALPGGQVVNKAASSTAVASSSNPSVYGQSGVTFTATVTSAASGTPSGTVIFYANAAPFSTNTLSGGSIISGPLPITLAPGSYTVTAFYGGDAYFATNTGTLSPLQSVGKASSSTVVISPSNPSSYGQSGVTFTATVSDASSGSTGTPSGTVVFSTNTVPFSTNTLSGGIASSVPLSTTLAPGNYTVTAAYNGDVNFTTSSGTLSGGQTVNKANSLTAVVSSAAGAAGPVLYDNSEATQNGNFNYFNGEAGNEVILAGSSASDYITNFEFQYDFIGTGSPAGGETARLRFYANDGSLVNGYASPGTVLFDSGAFPIAGAGTPGFTTGETATFNQASLGGGVVVPQTFTWTVTFAGLAAGENAGLALYSPATIGTNFNDAWVNQGSSWQLEVASIGPPVDFAALADGTGAQTYGQSGVTFTATVTGPGGTPTGTVQFQTNGVNFGSVVTLSGGSATSGALPATLAPGSYTVTAAYSGDTDFNGSSGTLSGGDTVGQAASLTTVTSSPSTSVYGQSGVTFSVTVTDASSNSTGTPTGTVQFQTNGVPFGSAVTLSGGSASLALPATLPAGSYAVAAVYSGDLNFFTSAGTLSGGQTVTQAASSTAVISSSNPSLYGQLGVTFTATVGDATSGSSGTPTGRVQFYLNGHTMGAMVSLSGGSATSSALATVTVPGTYAVTATYVGDVNFTSSTGTLSGGQTVNQAASSTLVSSSSNPSAYGQSPVTFTATVIDNSSGSVGTPTGTVQFQTNGQPFGSATLSGGSASSGSLSITLAPGNYIVTAAYSGDGNFTPSGGTLSGGQVVNKANSATAVASSSGGTNVYGLSGVTFTATVTDASSGSAGTRTGTVQFYTNAVAFGSAVTLSSGTASSGSLSTTLVPGTYTVTATYSGDVNFNTSTGTLSPGQVVIKANSSVAVVSSAAGTSGPVLYNDTTNTQNGNFNYFNGEAGNELILAGTSTNDYITNFVFQYDFIGPNGAIGTPVGGETARLRFYANNGPLVDGYASPGTVLFDSGAFTIATNGIGYTLGETATFNQAALGGAGIVVPRIFTWTVTFAGLAANETAGLALYSPATIGTNYNDAWVNVGSGWQLEVASLGPPVDFAAVVFGIGALEYGQSGLTFTATVTDSSASSTGTPTGTVQFQTNGIAFGSPATLSGGTATLAPLTLPAGTYTVAALYNGDTDFNTSTGTLGIQTVAKVSSSVAVSSSSNPSLYGKTGVTFTVTVSDVSIGSTGTPTGTVQFYTNAAAFQSPVTLSAGTATLTLPLTLQTGSYTVTANYLGDVNFNTNTGTLSGGQTVNKANSSTAVASTLNPSAYGDVVTFTATVSDASTGSSGTPTGTVQFLTNGVNFGAAVTLSGGSISSGPLPLILAPGNYTVTAAYSGDGNFNTSGGTLSSGQTVTQASTSTTVTSSGNPYAYGKALTFTATVTDTSSGSTGTATGTVQFYTNAVAFQSPVTMSGGSAILTPLTFLPVGSYTVTASYTGDGNFTTSIGTLSVSGVELIIKATSATAVGSTLKTSVFGNVVSFTATVTDVTPGSSVTPTGTVQFSTNGVAFGSPVTLSSGSASVPMPVTLPVGNYAVTAAYAGDGNFNTSSGTLSGGQTVHKATSSTAVISSSNPSAYGQSGVTFTATVSDTSSGSTGTPTGTVQFYTNAVAFGSPATLSGGSAGSGPLSTLAPGSYTVTASYTGDVNFSTSSGTLSPVQSVGQASSLPVLTSSSNPSVYGQSGVTFTATVTDATSSSTGTPTGTVQFYTNAVAFGSVVTLSGGSASTGPLSTTLAPGNYSVTVTYSGDVNFTASGGTLIGGQTVNKASSLPVLTSSSNPSVYGQSGVTFTATVTDASSSSTGTPTGTVQFYTNAVAFGSAVTLSGGSASSGPLSITLVAGSYTVTAAYAGDGNFNTSNGTLSGGQTVNQASTSTAVVSSSAGTSVYGQSGVTFTATVSDSSSGSAGTPAGTVQFYTNAVAFGSPATLSGGSASSGPLSITLVPGNYTVTAAYTGNGNFSTSSGTLSGGQTVNKAASSTAVASTLNPSAYGDGVTFTATVSDASIGSTGTPTGAVQFKLNGANFGSAVTLSGGSASSVALTTGSPPGNYSVTAVYSGDGNFNTSSGSLSGGQTVAQAASSTAVHSSSNPSAYGQSGVTFTATVSDASSGSTGTPTGTVQFKLNGVNFGSVVTLSAGSASSLALATGSPPGNYAVTAVYGGDGNFTTSSGTLSGGQTVSFVSSATAVASSSPTSMYGQSGVTFTATVTGAGGTPTGTVQFQTNGVAFGSAVTLSGGSASMALPATMPAGSYTVAAVYSGDSLFATNSGTLIGGQTVNQATSSTAVASSSPTSVYGQSGVTFTATVSDVSSGSIGTPTGTVQFKTNGVAFGSAVTLSGGSASLALPATFPAGSYTVTAAYSSDGNFSNSSGTLSGGQTVNQASTSTAVVSSSAGTSVYGQSGVTFTATVSDASSGSSGTPTGTVQFKTNGVAFGSALTLSGGSASLPLPTTLAPGSYTVTAVYSGNGNFGASSGTLSGGQTVNKAASSTAVVSATNPSVRGQSSTTFTATVTDSSSGSSGTPTGTVQFQTNGVNFGSAVTLSSGSGSSGVLPINLPAGNYTVTAAYSGDGNFTSSSGTLSGGQTVKQSVQTVVSFNGANGAYPYAGLVATGDPVLYGTTDGGGSSGAGTVFSVNSDGTGFASLYSFTNGTDGANPQGGLVLSGNMLYGTATAGGSGHGTVFAIRTNGTGFTVLHAFTGASDGANPEDGLILSGNTLYGTTYSGGSGAGTVFSIQTNGTAFATLHPFTGGADGANPVAGLTVSGNTLFGTTFGGGSGAGTVYSLQTNGTAFATLHSFAGSDGSGPDAGLLLSGNTLYGATTGGGSSSDGTVFSVQTNGTDFTNLYNFTGVPDGANPEGGLVLSGNALYGTANSGGRLGYGTIFQVNTDGTDFTNLYDFTGNADGAYPEAGLILLGNTLFGTAELGGSSGDGTVFSFVLSQVVVKGHPLITSISVSGTTLNLTATGGVPYGAYVLWQSSNVALPVAGWTSAATGTFDSSGNLSLSASIVSPGNPDEFYILSQ